MGGVWSMTRLKNTRLSGMCYVLTSLFPSVESEMSPTSQPVLSTNSYLTRNETFGARHAHAREKHPSTIAYVAYYGCTIETLLTKALPWQSVVA